MTSINKYKADRQMIDHVHGILKIEGNVAAPGLKERSADLISQVLSLAPQDVLKTLLESDRSLAIRLSQDSGLPMPMKTTCKRHKGTNQYTIYMQPHHADLSRNVFIGAFLREIAHVVLEIPPKEEWPSDRRQRAEMKEDLELKADALVWSWGLRHYDLAYIWATFPNHIAEQLISDIENYRQSVD